MTITITTLGKHPPRPTAPVLFALYLRAGLVLAGGAWLLGMTLPWWQRLLAVAAGVATALLDATDLVITGAHDLLSALLARLGWVRIPLAVAGSCWLAGALALPAPGRVALAALIGAVALMDKLGGRAAVAGGAR